MYQSPIIAHGFNHQSLFRQPVSNLRQINEVAWNRTNETQHMGNHMPITYDTIVNQQYVPGYSNTDNGYYPPLNDLNQLQIQSNQPAVNYQENGLLQTMMTGYPSTRLSRPINTTSETAPNRLLTRQSSLGAVPEAKNVSSEQKLPLSNSRSTGAIHDYMQKERRAHTMAPSTQILGPSPNIHTKMFASTTAPSDAQAMKQSPAAQTISNVPLHSYPQSNTGMIDDFHNNHRVVVIDNGEEDNEDDEEQDDDDDDAPIIVKVQYDPDAGGPPSEDVIRQAVDNQLKGQSRPKNDPIVLNFLNHPTQPEISPIRTRPLQPPFNRSAPSIPELFSYSQQQQPSVQQRQHQQQLFLQQQFQLEEKQRRQQQQKQEQQRQQQEFLLQQQQQKQKVQQYLQQQYELDEQRKEEQIRQERLQWEHQQVQKQLKKEQKDIELLIKQQLQREQQQKQRLLQLEQQQQELQREQQQQLQREQQQQLQREQQQQQKARQLFQQEQRQKQQELQQRNRQIYQSQQNAALPPVAPRSSRTVPTVQTILANKSLPMHPPNYYIYPTQTIPQASIPLRNPPQYPITVSQKSNNRNVNSTSTSNQKPPGLNVYNSNSHQPIPNSFMPIQLEGSSRQQFASSNGTNTNNTSPKFLQRSHTAPLAAEMFRPSSALDIPELSKENLRSMLARIPDLRGRRFSIEYAEPSDPAGYPIPSSVDDVNAKYPEAVIVDQLPTNIIQHVRSSDDIELKTALNLHGYPEKTAKPTTKHHSTSSELKQPSSKVYHHSARPKQRVKRSRPVLSALSDYDDSSTETEVEEIEIEIVPLSKYRNRY